MPRRGVSFASSPASVIVAAMQMVLAVGLVVFCHAASAQSRDRLQQSSCQVFMQRHPRYHMTGGDGNQPCLFQVPPPTFNPLAASDIELEDWGLAKRPIRMPGESELEFSKDLQRWRKQVAIPENPKKGAARAYQCTLNQADFRGPPSIYSMCGIVNGKLLNRKIIEVKPPVSYRLNIQRVSGRYSTPLILFKRKHVTLVDIV